MRLKLQTQVNGKWAYVSHTNNGNIVTTTHAYEALTATQETLNQLSNEYYGVDFRTVR